ncbi:auxilin-like protein [Trifolium pratense]|uniref:Auxilin-like protein n=1 Tax=Trifolium pratense TaxID=57577 RepID=A0A2K3N2B5_TRIPR|nr:auxilin-like protein [Trifolium pratense]
MEVGFNMTTRGKAVFGCLKGAHAQDFLLAISIDGLGQHMSLIEYRTILRHAGISVKKEAPVNFLTDPQERRSTLHPSDIMVFGLVGGNHACLNLTEVSPLVGLGVGDFTV